MALFFRAERRMFFLILLGWPSDEKNHAAFVRDLREFSRAGGCVVDRVGAWRGRGWPWKQRVAGGAAHGWRPALARRATRAGRVEARALTVGLHSVSICPGRRISTMDMRLDAPDRALTLTFEMHRDSSRFGDPRSVFDRVLMLTCRIHSLSSGVGRWISTSGLATRSIGGSSSPLEFTALRVGLEAGYSHRAGETFDRGVTLPVEIHSLSSGLGGRISTSAWRNVRSRAHPHR